MDIEKRDHYAQAAARRYGSLGGGAAYLIGHVRVGPGRGHHDALGPAHVHVPRAAALRLRRGTPRRGVGGGKCGGSGEGVVGDGGDGPDARALLRPPPSFLPRLPLSLAFLPLSLAFLSPILKRTAGAVRRSPATPRTATDSTSLRGGGL
jgi:hypothetical protein